MLEDALQKDVVDELTQRSGAVQLAAPTSPGPKPRPAGAPEGTGSPRSSSPVPLAHIRLLLSRSMGVTNASANTTTTSSMTLSAPPGVVANADVAAGGAFISLKPPPPLLAPATGSVASSSGAALAHHFQRSLSVISRTPSVVSRAVKTGWRSSQRYTLLAGSLFVSLVNPRFMHFRRPLLMSSLVGGVILACIALLCYVQWAASCYQDCSQVPIYDLGTIQGQGATCQPVQLNNWLTSDLITESYADASFGTPYHLPAYGPSHALLTMKATLAMAPLAAQAAAMLNITDEDVLNLGPLETTVPLYANESLQIEPGNTTVRMTLTASRSTANGAVPYFQYNVSFGGFVNVPDSPWPLDDDNSSSGRRKRVRFHTECQINNPVDSSLLFILNMARYCLCNQTCIPLIQVLELAEEAAAVYAVQPAEIDVMNRTLRYDPTQLLLLYQLQREVQGITQVYANQKTQCCQNIYADDVSDTVTSTMCSSNMVNSKMASAMLSAAPAPTAYITMDKASLAYQQALHEEYVAATKINVKFLVDDLGGCDGFSKPPVIPGVPPGYIYYMDWPQVVMDILLQQSTQTMLWTRASAKAGQFVQAMANGMKLSTARCCVRRCPSTINVVGAALGFAVYVEIGACFLVLLTYFTIRPNELVRLWDVFRVSFDADDEQDVEEGQQDIESGAPTDTDDGPSGHAAGRAALAAKGQQGGPFKPGRKGVTRNGVALHRGSSRSRKPLYYVPPPKGCGGASSGDDAATPRSSRYTGRLALSGDDESESGTVSIVLAEGATEDGVADGAEGSVSERSPVRRPRKVGYSDSAILLESPFAARTASGRYVGQLPSRTGSGNNPPTPQATRLSLVSAAGGPSTTRLSSSGPSAGTRDVTPLTSPTASMGRGTRVATVVAMASMAAGGATLSALSGGGGI